MKTDHLTSEATKELTAGTALEQERTLVYGDVLDFANNMGKTTSSEPVAETIHRAVASANKQDLAKGAVPGTASNQNLGHNSKKEGLGTRRD